jgi:hypothetical protein
VDNALHTTLALTRFLGPAIARRKSEAVDPPTPNHIVAARSTALFIILDEAPPNTLSRTIPCEPPVAGRNIGRPEELGDEQQCATITTPNHR